MLFPNVWQCKFHRGNAFFSLTLLNCVINKIKKQTNHVHVRNQKYKIAKIFTHHSLYLHLVRTSFGQHHCHGEGDLYVGLLSITLPMLTTSAISGTEA